MTTDNTCPICGFQGISADKAKCPQCDADMSCFRVLDSLPDSLPDTLPIESAVPRYRSRVGVVIVLLLCLVLGGLSGWIFRDKQVSSLAPYGQIYPVGIKIDMATEMERRACRRLVESEGEVAAPAVPLIDTPETGKDRKKGERDLSAPDEKKYNTEESGKKTVEEKVSQQGDAFWTYHAVADDTLWRIAQTYYGSGYYYPVLLKDNPGLEIYDLKRGVPVRIRKDLEKAEQVYEEITTEDGDKFYYLYVVEKGDTLKSIARKFYGTESAVDRIRRLNPDVTGTPGEVIRIAIE